jgi:hypothetical protein
MGDTRNAYTILAIKHFKKKQLETQRQKDNMKMPITETG